MQTIDLGIKRIFSATLLFAAAMLWAGNLNSAPPPGHLLSWNNAHLYPASFAWVPLLLAMSLHPWVALDNVATRFIGKISYSMYLTHFWVQLVLSRMWHIPLTGSWNTALFWLTTLGITVPVSMVCRMLVEEPGIALGRKLIAKLEGRRPAMIGGTGLLDRVARQISSFNMNRVKAFIPA